MSALKNGKIEGEMVYLRPITVQDTDCIVRWRNSENVRPYFIYQKPFTHEGHLEWLKTMIDSGNGFQFIICEKETGRAIGSTYLRDYDRENHKIEYGMFIGEKNGVGKGVGTEIVKLTLQYAFEDLEMHKVFCRIYADNMASIKSCEKGGFNREAYLEDDVYVNGRYHDMVLLGAIHPGKN